MFAPISTSYMSSIGSYFSLLIEDILAVERQPITRLKQQRDALEVKLGVYRDTQTLLNDLQTLAKDFLTSGTIFGLRKATVSNVPSGATVLTASASASAASGTYEIAVTALALAHRVRSDQQLYDNQALGLSGTFVIGGAAARSATPVTTISNTVTGFDVAAPASGQRELGTGDYYVEVRENGAGSGDWEFRIVDAEGKAVTVNDAGTSGTTSGWQDIADVTGGVFDTGRGLVVHFGTDPAQYRRGTRGDPTYPAARVSYIAQGATITVEADDTLRDIASAINSASYAEGNAVTASIVDRQLVLTAAATGAAHTIAASDSTGTVLQSLGILTDTGAFKTTLQSARDATFTVNGLTMTRSRNTGLDDVISGVTLNLAADAEGQSATLTIAANTAAIRAKIDAFLTKFNEVQSYLQTKAGVTQSGTGESATYTRGPLADDSLLRRLRTDLFSAFTASVSGLPAGAASALRQIGIDLDSNLTASVTDSAKLDAALNGDFNNVAALFNGVMARIVNVLNPFTDTTTGSIETEIESLDKEIDDLNDEIARQNERLDDRRVALTAQYAQLQAQLVEMLYQQQQMSAFGSSLINYSF